ncbi:MAG: TlyA family RNA methyltransferase [Thermodesulfobacteriota bacterium]|nr:TlyA family RNA methyltransferase [Thermodesulfobacteriota bacterium]
MSCPSKKRLDTLLVEKGLTSSRQQAQALIMAGSVLVNDMPATKAGAQVSPDVNIKVKDQCPYVSRGGLKLEGALNALSLDVTGLTCLDVGASTGGFTDCLLQRNAAHVFAVDVGYGQFAWKLRQDPRVTIIERTNIRHMKPDAMPAPVDLAVIDVSFISLKIVIPATLPFIRPSGRILALIKPQFEVGKGKVGKGGVVRDPALHQEVITALSEWAAANNLSATPATQSPTPGPKGNIEFFAIYQPNHKTTKTTE